jgi:putative copper resistance protein D
MEIATLVGARLIQFSAALILFGAPMFFLYGFEAGSSPTAIAERSRWQRPIVLTAAVFAFLGAFVWIFSETAAVSDDPNDAFNAAALWLILSKTHFGHAALARIALLIVSIGAALCVRRPRTLWVVQTLLGGGIVASFAWTGHGATSRGAVGMIHLAADLLHLLTAGIWIGALLSLVVLIVRSNNSRAFEAVRAAQFGLDRFSAIGVLVVAVLVLSGLVNSWFLIAPHWHALLTTPYGILLLVKLALFVSMLGLAALNRYWAAPSLRDSLNHQCPTRQSLHALRTIVATETGLALLVLISVSILGMLVPPVSGP